MNYLLCTGDYACIRVLEFSDTHEVFSQTHSSDDLDAEYGWLVNQTWDDPDVRWDGQLWCPDHAEGDSGQQRTV